MKYESLICQFNVFVIYKILNEYKYSLYLNFLLSHTEEKNLKIYFIHVNA